MRVLLVCVWLLAVAPSGLGAIVSEASTPFVLLDGGGIVVPVWIGEAGPFRFLLDTGASRSAVSSRLAGRLGLVTSGHTEMRTPAGTGTVPLVTLAAIRIGEVEAAGLAVIVLPHGRAGRRADIDGLIGRDVVAARTFTIDYRRRRIEWHARGADIPGRRLPLIVEGGASIVLLLQPDGRTRLRLIPDSGADGLVLVSDAARPRPRLTPLDIAGLAALGGRQVVRRAIVDDLAVGDVRLRAQVALIVERSTFPLGADGLLPLHLFARVTFHPAGYVIVEGVRRLAAARSGHATWTG